MPVFLDTNVWVYAFSQQDTRKQAIGKHLIESEDIIVSHQLQGELANTLLKQGAPTESVRLTIATLIERYPLFERVGSDYATSLDRRSRYTLSFWDSMLLQDAFRGGCSIFYSEDLHDGQTIDERLRIVNPFKS